MKVLYIDLFCGAGGTTTGVMASRKARVVACVNHDEYAIASHAANHPGVLHFTEDIRLLDTAPMVKRLREVRREYGASKVVLWASLECTHFSRAKGGQSRDPDSRSLADHLFRYVEALSPDYIQIENVTEFLSWGPLVESGGKMVVDRERKGEFFNRWFDDVECYGYRGEWRVFNAADFGAYTSRTRLFIQFAKDGLPIAWPEPTHSREEWKACREVLDLENYGESIFTRKKPLVDATLRRIAEGVRKFCNVPDGDRGAFMQRYFRGGGHVCSVDEPCSTITTNRGHYATSVMFMQRYFSGTGHVTGVDVPCGTLTTVPHQYPTTVTFMDNYFGKGYATSIDEPVGTICTKEQRYPVTACFMANYYSGGGQLRDVKRPCPTLTTVAKPRVVQCAFMDQQFGQSSAASLDNPAPSITTNPHYSVVSGLSDPAPFIELRERGAVYHVYEDDSPAMVDLKKAMEERGIGNIHMRGLTIEESLVLMGFPKGYKLMGTMTQQRKFVGNAVEVNMSRCLAEALCDALNPQMEFMFREEVAV